MIDQLLQAQGYTDNEIFIIKIPIIIMVTGIIYLLMDLREIKKEMNEM